MSSVTTTRLPRLVMIGRQGSGKGEQCSRLARTMGLDHVSTGERLRAEVRRRTTLGRAAELHLVRGEPVPDDLVESVVTEALVSAAVDGRGIVLDGYPRTVAQARWLADLVAPATIDLAIHLDVPRSIAVERIENRRICPRCHTSGIGTPCAVCGAATARRPDDSSDAIGRRMSNYARQLDPLLEWFDRAGLLATVQGTGTPEQVEASIAMTIANRVAVDATATAALAERVA